ncbi:immunoglobulin I-set domain protein, partial [Trichinella nativa]
LTVTRLSDHSVNLEWNYPSETTEDNIDGYDVLLKGETDDEWSVVAILDRSQTHCILEDLTNSYTYKFAIRIRKEDAQSELLETESEVYVQSRAVSLPKRPKGPLKVNVKTMSSIYVEWNPADAEDFMNISSYVVLIRESQRTTWLEVATVGPEETRCHVSDLNSGSEYHVRVIAVNSLGISEPLETEHPILMERIPTLLTPPSPCKPPLNVLSVHNTSVTLQWNPPEDDGGSPITGYVISRRHLAQKHWEEVERLPEFVLEYTVSNLKQNARYLFRVNAVNSIGISEGTQTTEPVNIRKWKGKHYKPGAPGKPTVKELNADFIVLQWSPPEAANNATVTNYIVERRDEGCVRKNWLVVSRGINPNAELLVERLIPGNTYTFRVSAENDSGIGPASEISDNITLPLKTVGIAPNFLTLLEDTSVFENEDITFNVQFCGQPAPRIKWYKNGREICSDEKHRISTAKNHSSFQLLNASENDEGEIAIEAENCHGTVTQSAQLKLKAVAKIIRNEITQNELFRGIGETAHVSFEVKGSPLPTVTWEKDHQQLTVSNRVSVQSDGPSQSLEISQCTYEDSGIYTLRAANIYGEDSIDVKIKITGAPSSPGKPVVLECDEKSITISWTPPLYNGEAEITLYYVESLGVGNDWTVFGTTKQEKLTASFTVEETPVKFRVKAENVHGISEPSEATIWTRMLKQTEDITVGLTFQQYKEKQQRQMSEFDSLVLSVPPTSLHKTDDQLPGNFYDKYTLCEELGRGAYGVVYRAIENATGLTFAAKIIQTRPGIPKDNVLHEIDIMSQLNHPSLLTLHEAFDMNSEMILVLEFVSGGELFDQLLEGKENLPEKEVREYIRQILHGIEHMHQKQIVHLDLKPENILLSTSFSKDIKIIDFGLASKLKKNKSVQLLFGTPEFCAPEVVNHQSASFCTDMWSVGVIAYCMLSGISPFAGDTDEETLANVSVADWNFDDSIWTQVSDTAKDFVSKLMTKNKNNRMTVEEALQHPWITEEPAEVTEIAAPVEKHLQRPVPQLKLKKDSITKRRWSDELLPIGKLAKHSAILRQASMDGVFERELHLEVPDKIPNIIAKLENTVAEAGDLVVKLKCTVDGSPRPNISWFKNGVEITTSKKYKIIHDNTNAELNISNISEDDEAVYSCIAENKFGYAETAARLAVKKVHKEDSLKRNDSVPTFFSCPYDQNVMVGESILNKLNGLILVGGKPFPQLKWYKNGKQINDTSEKYRIQRFDNKECITIQSFQKDDAGLWQCIAINDLGTCEVKFRLTLKYPEEFCPPKIIENLKDISVENGQSFQLQLLIEANPLPEIKWYKNNTEIHHGEHYKMYFDDKNSTYALIVNPAYVEDSGIFKCVITNIIGSDETSCKVTVEEYKYGKELTTSGSPPSFRIPLEDQTAVEGEDHTFVCLVDSIPQAEITWLKDNEPIGTVTNQKVENGICSLVLRNINQNDAGVFSCVASNVYGTCRTDCNFSVHSEVENAHYPEFLQILTDVTVEENSQIALECLVEGIPFPKITWYKNDCEIEMTNRMMYTEDISGHCVLRILNANEKDAGIYLCRAKNTAGETTTQCVVTVVGK